MDFFTRERIQQMTQASEQPVEPLLVMGNPRSGTTLLDTILGMHPEVVSGGELSIGAQLEGKLTPLLDSYLGYPECLAELRTQDANALAHTYSNAVGQLSQGRRFVTNKALNINLQYGFLRCVAPGMRTISLHRHPLDNCVSCFMSLIPMRGHGYVQDQEKMARVWIARRRLQDHWAEVMTEDPILQLHYESMVNNQTLETKRILDFLNLDFDENCLRFHESDTVAATVSSKQVQQPMYNTSAGRWQRYEKHLSVLIDRLDFWLR
ncbi:MAG: sulfotransferase, partial [Planctomycetota bacterium]